MTEQLANVLRPAPEPGHGPCQICDYKFNLTVRKLVSCPYCNFDACRTCCETYILNESSAKCMNPSCSRDWTRKFLRDAFTATFVNKKFKEHREKLLFDQERSLLPATQPIVETMIRQENINRQVDALAREISERRHAIHRLRIEAHNLGRRAEREERSEFVRACPDAECRGFLSTQWKCGLCEKWSCPDCHEVKGLTRDVEHVCDPDTLATARLLAGDTRSCPKCSMGIFRVDGCDVMFCTQCHTSFNWRTGKIMTTNLHNPHYFEWLRMNGNVIPRQAGDNPCAREINHHTFVEIRNILRIKHKDHPLAAQLILDLERIIRNTMHLRDVEMYSYRDVDIVQANQELRIQYMRNLITEVKFKTDLQRSDKRAQKRREIRNVFELLSTTVTDIVLRFYQSLVQEEPGQFDTSILEEVKPIVNYANESLADIARTYTSKAIRFNDNVGGI